MKAEKEEKPPVNALAFANLKGNLFYVNPCFLKLLGYKNKEEIINRSIVEFLKNNKNNINVMDSLYQKKHWSGEINVLKKDNSTLNARLSASIITDNQDMKICVMLSLLDIVQPKIKKLKLNIKKRIKELDGLYSLGKLMGESINLDEIFVKFVKDIVPPSMQFPDKAF